MPKTSSEDYHEGILLGDEFKGEDDQLYVICKLIEDIKDLEKSVFRVPSKLLERIQ
jgi:hypothetical protein